ncbi:MAG TPA: lysylphosphatidylglycerol synthase transmembrane domain-containing protein [Acidimicrobiales bacterium]|nr:lysylphosphatidylglycerol synthase transmembrane domain-containing protein [Acidimicrobiales bacterium]
MTTPPDPPIAAPGRGRWVRAWPAIKTVVALAAVGLAAWAISGKTDELRGVTGYLDHLHWVWVLVAVMAEVSCYLALSQLQRRLLRAGRIRIPVPQMFGITMAGSAIQASFPAGSVVYLAYLFRQFRRWGADDLLATWVILAFNVVTFASLAAISAVGLALAASAGSAYDLVEAILGILLVALLFVLAIMERRRLLPHVTRAVRLSQRLFHRPQPGRPADQVVAGWARELAAVSPSRGVWARSVIMSLTNWLSDLSCLALSFMAVGVGVPWRGLLLAYGAGQLASTLPITPGGLGAVEGSLTVALVTFGGSTESTVAAVLLYRVLSFWMILPVGWGSWATLALLGRSRAPAQSAVAALESPASGAQT